MKDALEKVLAEKYPQSTAPLRPTARAPTPLLPPPVLGSPLSPAVILARAQRQPPLPKGRLSRSMADLAYGWWWPSEMLAGRSRAEVIQLCRDACEQDADSAGALRDIVALANPGFSLSFTGSERAKAQAKRALDELETHLGDFRSWDALINHQVSEAFMAGAGSLESYPTPGRSGVAGVEMVPAEEVTILRTQNERQYLQRNYGVLLDERTYVYSAFDLRGRDPHGTPVMVAVLMELERQIKLMGNIDKIVGLIAEGPFLEIGVPPPDLTDLGVDDPLDPRYNELLEQYYQKYVEIALSARERGVVVVQDKAQSKAVPLTTNVAGMGELQMLNNLRKWTGMMTLPFMRGKTEGTTQALAEVIYPVLLSHSENLRLIAKSTVLFIMNNHLRWQGIAASVELDFHEPPNPFLESHAKARLAEAQADAIYMEQLGPEYVRQVTIREEIDTEAVLAWREKNKPAPPPMTAKADVQGVDGGAGNGLDKGGESPP